MPDFIAWVIIGIMWVTLVLMAHAGAGDTTEGNIVRLIEENDVSL